jgi:hypothetical protein
VAPSGPLGATHHGRAVPQALNLVFWGPITMPWFTINNPNVVNGTHTLGASVRDANGNTATTSIAVIVKN